MASHSGCLKEVGCNYKRESRMTLSLSKGHWFVYIAQARTGRYYTGITTDVEARIKKHNSGKGSMFALEQGPFRIVYVSGAIYSKSEARAREAQIKRWTRAKKVKLINGQWV